MQFTVEAGGSNPPVGHYKVKFVGVEGVAANAEKNYGAAVRFKFEVTDGELKGKPASRVCPAKVSPDNVTGRFLSGLLGRPIALGESISLDACVGKAYLAIVGPAQGKGTRVESVI